MANDNYLSAEEEIALSQLARLQSIARERLLTPDEVKMYDLLVKNLRLVRQNPDIVAVPVKIISGPVDKELLALASGIETKKNE